nr:ferritin-like domain-containing protein [Paracoccaceae bacterium]
MPDAERQSAQEILVAGLRNAHAMERQAVAVLETQTRRLRDYPDFETRVFRHVQESRIQAERLENALRRCDAAPSSLKGVAMSAMGLWQSTAQLFADDAPVKAMLADTMFEHFEIAAYRSLLEIASLAGRDELRPDLEASLREEEAMARWLEENLTAVTRRYVARAQGTGTSAPAAAPQQAAAPGPGAGAA